MTSREHRRAWLIAGSLLLPGAGVLGLWSADHRAPAIQAQAPAADPTFPATPLWAAILRYVEASGAAGPGAASGYQAALANLKDRSPEVTGAIADRFDRIPPALTRTRQALLFLLIELADPRGEPLLSRLAAANESTSPPASHVNAHHTLPDPARVERLTAVNGLAKLAVAGDRSARQSMLRIVDHPDRQTRLAVARTLFAWFPHDSEIQATLRARVRPGERHTIDGSEKPYVGPGAPGG